MPDGWTRAEVAGKPADVFEPAGPPRGFALLYLHPVGEESPADSAAYTAELRKHRLPCVAPRGRRSWWADRVCPEFDPHRTAERHLLEDVVPWMQARWNLGPRAVGVFGISMGGQGAVRLGFKYPDRFPVVASVAGAFDYHELHGRGTPLDEMYASKEQCRQDTAILHLDPYRWPPHVYLACDPGDADWFRGNDRLHEKLTALGVPHTADLTTSAGGHSWAYFDRMAKPVLEFVVSSLEREARRLV
jgi:S-formylglutathione hydrolase